MDPPQEPKSTGGQSDIEQRDEAIAEGPTEGSASDLLSSASPDNEPVREPVAMLDPDKPNRSKNALVHGVYASEILLPGEVEKDFVDLHKAFQSELNPASPLEEEAVLDLTRLHWLKRRAIKGAKREFCGEQQPANQISANDRVTFIASVVDFQKRLEDLAKSIDRLNITSDGRNSSHSVRSMNENVTACQYQMGELKRSASYLNRVNEILRRGAVPYEGEAISYTYEPDDLERVLKIEALIDTRIAKVFARLDGIKEFRRLYGRTEVS